MITSVPFANLQKILGIDHVRSNIINESKLFILVQDIPEENAALGEIILVGRIETSDVRSDGKFAFQKLFPISWSRKRIGKIIRSAFLVHGHGLRSVSLIIHSSGSVWTIDGNLHEIRTQTMTVSVVVRKQPSLKYIIYVPPQCGNYGNFLLHFSQKFRESKSFYKKLVES